MSLKSILLGKNNLSNEDAIKIIVESIAIVGLLAYGFGPTEFGLWGLMAKAATFFGVL